MELGFSFNDLGFRSCSGYYPEGLRLSFKVSDLSTANPEDIIAVCQWMAEHESTLSLIQRAMEYCPGRNPKESQELISKLNKLHITEPVLEEHRRSAIGNVVSVLDHELDQMIGKHTKDSEAKKGYVYLLQSGPFYKIGVSTNVKRRVRELSTLPPFNINVICTIPSENRYELEGNLHTRFSDKHINGEWFELEPSDVAYIKGLANEQ